MKKWKIALLCILGAVIVGVGALAIWQRENIRALYTVLTRDSETIARELEEQREQHRKDLEDQAQIDVAPPTSQQTDNVLSGSATPQEVKDELGISDLLEKGKTAGIIPDDASAPPGEGESQPEGPGSSEPPADTPPPDEDGDTASTAPAPEEPAELTADELVNICVAELYSCQVDIMDTLRVLKEEAYDEWHSLPKEERTGAKKREIGLAGLNKCYELEVKVDSEVMEILARYRPLLEKLGADTSILDMLWRQYIDEKSAEKAYYLDKYMN